jgi:hypothetical protein
MNPSAQWDNVLDSLTAEPRRQIIASLLAAPHDRWLSLPDAAVSSHTADGDSLRTSLKHYHLPKLAELGYISWENQPFRLRRGPNFHVIGALVDYGLDGSDNYPDELVDGYELFEVRV